MQAGTVRCWRCTVWGREASFFRTQQFPLQRGNKLCASPTQKTFSFCQHNYLCWIWSSPYNRSAHKLKFYYLPCFPERIGTRVIVSVHTVQGGDMLQKMKLHFQLGIKTRQQSEEPTLWTPEKRQRLREVMRGMIEGFRRIWKCLLPCSPPAMRGIKTSLK